MSAIGRKCSVVNLDPANDHTSYPCALDVRDLVTLDEIMREEELGPNGGTLYAIEELENNIEWLEKGLTGLGGGFSLFTIHTYLCTYILPYIWPQLKPEDYVLFDCPGQVEIFTHHSSLRNIFFRIQKLGYRVCPLFVANVSLVIHMKRRRWQESVSHSLLLFIWQIHTVWHYPLYTSRHYS